MVRALAMRRDVHFVEVARRYLSGFLLRCRFSSLVSIPRGDYRKHCGNIGLFVRGMGTSQTVDHQGRPLYLVSGVFRFLQREPAAVIANHSSLVIPGRADHHNLCDYGQAGPRVGPFLI